MTSILTDSEWQIMRVIWENHPASATEITKMLIEVKAWSITTVKTFLARLVNKQLVNYEENGKMFLYSPLLSERDCVIFEMKQIINRIYGGKVLYQTPHYEFYGFDNPPLIQRLANHLEMQFERIEKRYHIAISERQQVYMYQSKNRLHSALGLMTAPDWLRASWEWDILHLAPEEAFDDITIEAAASMVWMQKVLFTQYPDKPYWLLQGIASVESNLINTTRLNQAMQAELPTLNINTVLSLSSYYDLFKVNHGFELASIVIEYIVSTIGWEGVLQFADNPNDYQSVFGCDETSFWKGWMNYVQSCFVKKEESI